MNLFIELYFYKQLYSEIATPNFNNSSTHPFSMHDLQICLKNILVNETQRAMHYHKMKLSNNNLLYSDIGFALVINNDTIMALPDQSKTINQLNVTELCAAIQKKPFNWWFVMLILLYLLLYPLILCCISDCFFCENENNNNNNELYLVNGIGSKLMTQFDSNALIQLEDFVYLIAPYNKSYQQYDNYKDDISLGTILLFTLLFYYFTIFQ